MATDLDVIANLTGAGITEAQAKTWFTAMRAALAEMGDPLAKYGALQNLTVVASVGSGALTVALKDRDGSDPAAASPCSVPFRNVTSATGDFSVINVAAANSLVISSGSTMGATSAKAFRLWLVGFNDGGTFRLGLINCLHSTNFQIFPLRDHQLASSTAEGGAGGADSAGVIYTGAAVSAKAMRILGYLEWSSGLTTAGTWDAVPTRIQLFGPGIALPGELIQVAEDVVTTASTGTTALPYDNTIPQNTEGDQYHSKAITPTSPANVLDIDCSGFGSHATNSAYGVALFQDSTAGALAAIAVGGGAATPVGFVLRHQMRAETASATTFKVRMGGASGATFTHLGASGSGVYSTSARGVLRVCERMA